MEYRFVTKPCISLTDKEYEQCSILFSNNYGKYSGKGDKQKGEQIKTIYSLCGFNDNTSFYRAFKKEFLITPKKYLNTYLLYLLVQYLYLQTFLMYMLHQQQ